MKDWTYRDLSISTLIHKEQPVWYQNSVIETQNQNTLGLMMIGSFFYNKYPKNVQHLS